MLYYAMDYAELVRDFKKKVSIQDEQIMIVLLADNVYAVQDKCTHFGVSLTKGTIEDGTIKCKAHHAIFDLKSGNTVEKAHIGFIKMPTKPLKTYSVVLKDDQIYIDL